MKLFLRGFLIVLCTAFNIRLISRGLYVSATVTGGLISALWWANAGSASENRTWQAGACYATGAALGTLTGMWLGGL
jgi:hypothetical protein